MLLLVLFVYVSLAIAKKEDLQYSKSAADSTKEYIRELLKSRENFTNCEEFLQNTRFDTKRLLNVTWQAFYIWQDTNGANNVVPDIIVNFHLPNTMMRQRYQETLSERNQNVNWTAAELFMEMNIITNLILLATNTSGLYYAIPTVTFNSPLKEDQELTAFKFVEPYYLGMMSCKYRQLTALAPVGLVPSEQQMESVAKQFKFRSNYGISILELNKKITQAARQGFSIGEDDRDLSLNMNEPDDNNLSII